MSPQLLSLFRDLSGSCEKVFRLLSAEHRVIATLVLRGSFPYLDTKEGNEKYSDEKVSLDLLYTSSADTTGDNWLENIEKQTSGNEEKYNQYEGGVYSSSAYDSEPKETEENEKFSVGQNTDDKDENINSDTITEGRLSDLEHSSSTDNHGSPEIPALNETPEREEEEQYENAVQENFDRIIERFDQENTIVSLNLSKLEEDIKSSHEKIPRKTEDMTCEVCGETFQVANKSSRDKKRNSYLVHMKRHNIMDTDCGCDIQFFTYYIKDKHMRVVHKGQFGCKTTWCKESFVDQDKLIKHEMTHKEDVICNECGKQFIHKQNMERHIKAIHMKTQNYHEDPQKDTKEKKVFSCTTCGKNFKAANQLFSHKKSHFQRKECQVCGKTVKDMVRHLRDHTEDSDQKFRCDQCGKSFSDSYRLKSHMMSVHLKTRPYKCRYGGC